MKKTVGIRDPLYGFIEITENEKAVIDSPPFQRLRGIKQLSTSYLVFPSAEHSRFSHSIGTMYLAGKIAERLGLDEDKTEILRLGALLHDIGHGPFSHLFDRISEKANRNKNVFDHEKQGLKILSATLKDVLDDRLPKILSVFNTEASLLHRLISGGIDCDKMDYLRRDSHHVGVKYGNFDIDRILFTMSYEGEFPCILAKGFDAIEGFRLAREQMHTQVYTHHTRLIADEMLVRAAEYASREDEDRNMLTSMETTIGSVSAYLKTDDSALIYDLSKSSNIVCQKIISRFRHRDLYKRAFVSPVKDLGPQYSLDLMSKDTADDYLNEVASVLAKKVALPVEEIYVLSTTLNMKQYQGMKSGEPIMVKTEDGDLKEYGEMAYLRRSGDDDPQKIMIFGPSDKVTEIRSAAISQLMM